MLQIKKIKEINKEEMEKIVPASVADINEIMQSCNNSDIVDEFDDDLPEECDVDDFLDEHIFIVGVKK